MGRKGKKVCGCRQICVSITAPLLGKRVSRSLRPRFNLQDKHSAYSTVTKGLNGLAWSLRLRVLNGDQCSGCHRHSACQPELWPGLAPGSFWSWVLLLISQPGSFPRAGLTLSASCSSYCREDMMSFLGAPERLCGGPRDWQVVGES